MGIWEGTSVMGGSCFTIFLPLVMDHVESTPESLCTSYSGVHWAGYERMKLDMKYPSLMSCSRSKIFSIHVVDCVEGD